MFKVACVSPRRRVVSLAPFGKPSCGEQCLALSAAQNMLPDPNLSAILNHGCTRQGLRVLNLSLGPSCYASHSEKAVTLLAITGRAFTVSLTVCLTIWPSGHLPSSLPFLFLRLSVAFIHQRSQAKRTNAKNQTEQKMDGCEDPKTQCLSSGILRPSWLCFPELGKARGQRC